MDSKGQVIETSDGNEDSIGKWSRGSAYFINAKNLFLFFHVLRFSMKLNLTVEG